MWFATMMGVDLPLQALCNTCVCGSQNLLALTSLVALPHLLEVGQSCRFRNHRIPRDIYEADIAEPQPPHGAQQHRA